MYVYEVDAEDYETAKDDAFKLYEKDLEAWTLECDDWDIEIE